MSDAWLEQIDQLRERLELLSGEGEHHETSRFGLKALDELVVAVEELQAQNAELVASRADLDDAQKKYRRLFESVPDGYVITDSVGIVREANATASRLFNRPRELVIGKPLSTFVSAPDQIAFYTLLNRMSDASPGEHLSINLDVRDHEFIPANLSATLIRSEEVGSAEEDSAEEDSAEDGSAEISWLLRDRRHDLSTEEIRHDEELLRRLLSTAPIGILLCDVEGAILFSNVAADKVLSRRPESIALGAWLQTTDTSDRAMVVEMVRGAAKSGEPGSLCHKVRTRHGFTRWVDHVVSPFRDASNELAGFVSTLTDITAEREAVIQLQASRDFTSALLDTVGALVVVLDPDHEVVRFNRSCEAMTGYSSDEVVGRPFVDTLIALEDRRAVERRLSSRSSPHANRLEGDWVTKDGRRRRVSWTTTNLIGDDGSLEAIIGAGIDVTDQRLLEYRLVQTDRLEAIGRVTSGIAHDFNNTLTTLRLRIDRMSARGADGDHHDDIDAAARTIDRTRALISDILSFSSPHAVDPSPFDVNAETRGLVDVLAEIVGDAVSVEVNLTDLDTTVFIDPERFEQVLTNLVINGSDAMLQGGVMTIATSSVSISPDAAEVDVPMNLRPGDYVVVTVTDTGTGIPSWSLPNIFDPYFTTKPRGRGTGLGLATAYGAVTTGGGTITVDTEVGRGSTFAIWLPRDREAVPQLPASGSNVVTNPYVLIVDDDDEVRETLVAQLLNMGYRSAAVGSGSQALEFLDEAIGLLITDIQLPDINGDEVARRFARVRPDLRIVFISGSASALLHADLTPVSVMLRKPFSSLELQQAIGDLPKDRA